MMTTSPAGLATVLALLVFLSSVGRIESGTRNIFSCTFAYGESCDEISFHLWTRRNPDMSQEVTAQTLASSNFNPSQPTKIILHGYASGVDLYQLVDIRNAYLDQGDYNIIMPDYLRLVSSPCYPVAVFNIRYVGKCIARFIRDASPGSGWLGESVPVQVHSDGGAGAGASSEEAMEAAEAVRVKLHVIGFSLGGQTAGFVGRNLKPKYILDRITGLDPAMPLFVTRRSSQKLTAHDALLVDVVHTNAFAQGKAESCGHVDFYMNGGMYQPGCFDQHVTEMLKCDHSRAPTYFSESIRSSRGFWGWRCPSIEEYELGRCPARGEGALMGERWDPKDRGTFFVVTNAKAPFATGLWWRNGTSTTPAPQQGL